MLVSLTPELADHALRLGEIADKLAAEDPLVPPQRRARATSRAFCSRRLPGDCRLAARAPGGAGIVSFGPFQQA